MIVELQSVWKAYGEGEARFWAIRDAGLMIQAGDFVSVAGPSGSGKSTLLHMLGCLDKPTKGTVLVDEESIDRLTDRQLSLIRRNRIGFVFQQYYLNECMTALQNVLLPLELAKVKDRKKKAGEALAWVGLGHKVKAYPSELSGGEQQRCAIARALANSPEIVLADEPTGCLDTKTGEKIMDVLTDLNEQQEIGIVVVTHDEMVASSAREQIQVRDGRIS